MVYRVDSMLPKNLSHQHHKSFPSSNKRLQINLLLSVSSIRPLHCKPSFDNLSIKNIYHINLPRTEKLIPTMHAQAIMGRGGYNKSGRGGYNRFPSTSDVKSSGVCRPSNPYSMGIRSSRSNDDGRGGYNSTRRD